MYAYLSSLGDFGVFGGRVLWRAFTPPLNYRELVRQIWRISFRCMGPVLATTFPFGLVITLQGLQIFNLFGAQRMLPSLITTTVIRELSPLLASVLIAAQGGSAYAAELGAMRIKEELDATEIMAVDGLRWHVVPRLLALTIACPMLQIFGAVAGIGGGYVMAVLLKNEPEGTFVSNLWNFTTPMDIASALIKTVVFGLLIGLISCYKGFYASGGAAGVGRAVNDTVVQAVLAIFAANYLLTSAFTVS